MKRCTQCDIPLVARPCPNPECREVHGRSAGDLCQWCSQHQVEFLRRQVQWTLVWESVVDQAMLTEVSA
jgi:hypothetical protein